MRLRHVVVTMVAFWVIGALATAASASDFRLRIEKLSPTGALEGVVVTDVTNAADLGDGDQDETAGRIMLILPGISLTTGFSKPAVPVDGLGILSELAIDAFSVHSDSAGTIRLTLEDTGYPGAGGTFTDLLRLKSSISNLSAGAGITGTYAAYAATNYVPDLGKEQAAWGDISTNPSGGVDISPTPYYNVVSGDLFADPTGQADLDFAANFNMFTQITLNFSGAGDISFSQVSTLTSRTGEVPNGTPEPGSLMLISTSLLGLFGARRRFKLPGA